jgi:hypothetical protein
LGSIGRFNGIMADNIKRVVEEQMPIKVRRKNVEPRRADDKNAWNQKDEGWEERLRLVGDARFVEVEWSKRDNPSWPLPIK